MIPITWFSPANKRVKPAEVESEGGKDKPLAVLEYNRTEGGIDNLDKITCTYSCRRKTSHWPIALFHNMLDVAGYNAFVLWWELKPFRMAGKLNRPTVIIIPSKMTRTTAEPRNAEENRAPQAGVVFVSASGAKTQKHC